jgi:hypothetical protein
MVLVELHDAWSRFTRDVVCLSTFASPKTLLGATVAPSPGFTSRSAVLLHLQTTWGVKPKWTTWEPHWYDAAEALKATQLLRLSNRATVSASLGAVDNPEADVRVVRNFLAHRGPNTAAKVSAFAQRMNLGRDVNVDHLLHSTVAPGRSLLDDWVFAFRRVAQAACS